MRLSTKSRFAVTAMIDMGLRQHQEFIVALKVARVIYKACVSWQTTVVSFAQFVLLDHCAHSPIQNEDALL